MLPKLLLYAAWFMMNVLQEVLDHFVECASDWSASRHSQMTDSDRALYSSSVALRVMMILMILDPQATSPHRTTSMPERHSAFHPMLRTSALYLKWREGQIRPQRGPRQFLGPPGITYAPNRHSWDTKCSTLNDLTLGTGFFCAARRDAPLC